MVSTWVKAKRPNKRRKRTHKRRAPKQTYSITRTVSGGFPTSALVKLRGVNMLEVNPGISADNAYFEVNMNQPYDLIGTMGTGVTIATGVNETEARYADLYGQIYNNYEVISAKVKVTWLSNNVTQATAYGIACLADSDSGIDVNQVTALHYQEVGKNRAVVTYRTNASGSNASKVTLTKKINVRKLEGQRDKGDNTLVGRTASHVSGQSAPSKTPVFYCFFHALVSSVDLNTATVLVETEQIIRYQGLSTDLSAEVA